MKYVICILFLLGTAANAGLPPTTSKGSADATDLVTFKYRFPNFTGTHTGTIFSLGVNSVAGGGTGLSSTPTNGQLLIGNGTGYTLASLTAGSNITITPGSGSITIASTSSGTSGAVFKLTGPVVPFDDIDGTHYHASNLSLTTVNISMYDSGIAGSTTVRVNQYRAGSFIASATASLLANAGNPDGIAAALSGTLSILSGDVTSVDITSVAGGAPYDLVVEY